MQTCTLQHDFPHKSCGFSIYALISWNMFNKCPKSYEKQNINKHYRLGYYVLWHRVEGGEVRRPRMALTDEEDMSIFFSFQRHVNSKEIKIMPKTSIDHCTCVLWNSYKLSYQYRQTLYCILLDLGAYDGLTLSNVRDKFNIV